MPLNVNVSTDESVVLGDSVVTSVESTSELNKSFHAPSPSTLSVTSTPLLRPQRKSLSPSSIREQNLSRPNLPDLNEHVNVEGIIIEPIVPVRRYPLRERVKKKVFDV